MNNAELIEIRVVNKGILQYSFEVECDYDGQELLDIVTDELADKPDGYTVEVVPLRLLADDSTIKNSIH